MGVSEKWCILFLYSWNRHSNIHTYLYCICELWKFLQVLLLERDVNILPGWSSGGVILTLYERLRKSFGTKRRSGWSTFSTSAAGMYPPNSWNWLDWWGTLPSQIGVIFEVVWHCSGFCWNWDTTVEARLAVAGPTPCGLGFAASLLAFLQVATRKCPACRN